MNPPKSRLVLARSASECVPYAKTHLLTPRACISAVLDSRWAVQLIARRRRPNRPKRQPKARDVSGNIRERHPSGQLRARPKCARRRYRPGAASVGTGSVGGLGKTNWTGAPRGGAVRLSHAVPWAPGDFRFVLKSLSGFLCPELSESRNIDFLAPRVELRVNRSP
jgi:hypothetical protein